MRNVEVHLSFVLVSIKHRLGRRKRQIILFQKKRNVMSNVESSHVDVRALIQKLERSEKSIAFIQHEHGLTLGQLHEEMTRLQEKCSGSYSTT